MAERNRGQTDAPHQCPNHRRGQLSDEDYQKEAVAHAEVLCETLDFIRAQHSDDSPLLTSVLEGAEVFLGVKDLDMDCAVIRFTNTASGKAHMQCYMWDWLDAHQIEERADRISKELLELVHSGKLISQSRSRPTRS